MDELDDLQRIRREKLDKIRELGVEPYAYHYPQTDFTQAVIERFTAEPQSSITACEKSVCG